MARDRVTPRRARRAGAARERLARVRAALGLRRRAPRPPSWIAAAARASTAAPRAVERGARRTATYWWPLGLLTRAGRRSPALAGAPRSGALAGPIAAAAAVADDVTGGRHGSGAPAPAAAPDLERRRRGRRPRTPRGRSCSSPTTTPPTAGLLFAPRGSARVRRRPLPRRCSSAPTPGRRSMWSAVVGGPLLVALGALLGCARLRRAGTSCALGCAATIAEIGVARRRAGRQRQHQRRRRRCWRWRARWRERPPPPGARPCWSRPARRSRSWRACRPSRGATSRRSARDRTHVLCVDTVGSPHARRRSRARACCRCTSTPRTVLRRSCRAAAERSAIAPGARACASATRPTAWSRCSAGYPSATLGSVPPYKVPDELPLAEPTRRGRVGLRRRVGIDCATTCERGETGRSEPADLLEVAVEPVQTTSISTAPPDSRTCDLSSGMCSKFMP